MGLATQFDFQSGVALNALASVTKEQLLQAINQIAPLNNIGGVVYLDSSVDDPGILNNPRFSRYVWLDADTDPPTMKLWDPVGGAWVGVGLGEDAIINDHIKVAAVSLYDDAVGSIKKIALFNNDFPSGAWAGFPVRVDSAGKRLEAVSISTLLGTGSVPLASLVGGTDNYVLRMSGATPVWEDINFGTELTDGSVTLAKIVGGTPNFLIRVGAGGNLEAVSNNDISGNFLASGSILLTKIAQSGANIGYIPRWDGANWVAYEPPLGFTSSAEVSITGKYSTFLPSNGNWSETIAHGLGAKPKLVRLVYYTEVSGHGYSAGDELNETAIFWFGSFTDNDGWAAVSYAVDENNIYLRSHDQGGARSLIRGDSYTIDTITANMFKVKVYAWL